MESFKKWVPILIVIVITIFIFTYKEPKPTSRPINNDDVDFETIITLPELEDYDLYGLYSFNYKINRDTYEQICDGYFLFINSQAYLHICKNLKNEEKIYEDYTGQIGDNDGITCLSIQKSYKRFIEYRVDDYSDENYMTLYLLTQSGSKIRNLWK